MYPTAQQCNGSPEDVYDLLERLCISFMGPDNYMGALRTVSNFASTCPTVFGYPPPFDETSVVRKIVQHIHKTDTSSGIDDKEIGLSSILDPNQSKSSLFLHFYEKFRANQTESGVRNSVLTFLYFMIDKKYANKEDYTRSLLGKKSIPNPSARTCGFRRSESTPNANFIPQYSNPVIAVNPAPTFFTSASRKVYHSLTKASQDTVTPAVAIDKDSIASTSGTYTAAVSQGRQVPPNDSLKMWDPHHEMHEDVLQNVLYALSGVEGKYLRKDILTGKFKLDQRAAKTLSSVQCGIIMRISELGFYHDVVKSFGDPQSGSSALGLMGQGFVSEIREELTQYYGMVALLHEEYKDQKKIQKESRGENCLKRLTLLKVFVWYCKPYQRLKWLAIIAETCQEQKGGALISTIYSFKKRGEPIVKTMTDGLLVASCRPLYHMLIRWLFEGFICDPYGEFFIECFSEIGPDRLWYDKYRLRIKMLPTFVSAEMANKILVIGKSINFLREVCEERQPIAGRDEFERIIEKNPEYIFSHVPDTQLHLTIDKIYLATSGHLLDIITGRHKLFEHLQAMKRYLLLGQGDFISILMETLRNELNRPGKELYSYDLSSRMDAAIRATNPPHEDEEILNHLDVRLMTPCEGDVGWDILSLQYTVRGPLATMLEPSMGIYQILFKPLWRMKHMEFVLSTKIWKEQMCNTKPLRPLNAELQKTFYRLHMVTSEMIHFIHQMQYYILFEVIECNWVAFTERVQQAHSLDDILSAHDSFLNTIRSGIFLDSTTGELCRHLESVYDAIKRLEIWQERFYIKVFAELDARKQYRLDIEISEKEGKFGLTCEKQLENDQRLKIFEQLMVAYQKALKNIAADYEKAVRSFLLALNSHQNPNLQLFGIRLDFNEYYKKRDQTLSVPLTFERMRMSNIFYNNKSLVNSRYSTTN